MKFVIFKYYSFFTGIFEVSSLEGDSSTFPEALCSCKQFFGATGIEKSSEISKKVHLWLRNFTEAKKNEKSL